MGNKRRRNGRPQRRRSAARAAWALGLLAFAVYCANGRRIATNDSLGTSLLPLTALLDGSLTLDRFRAELTGATGIYESRFGLVSPYPIATGVLLVPFYALPVAARAASHPEVADWLAFAARAEKLSAATITACAAAVFLLLAHRLGASPGWSWAAGVTFAFGTEAWSTWSQALWQHGPGVLLILLAVLAGWRCKQAPEWRTAVLAGLACGLAVAVRPTNLLFAIPMLVWVFWPWGEHRLPALVVVAAFVAALAPFALYNVVVFGRPTGAYQVGLLSGGLLTGTAGTLLSPGRGLLVYFPLAALAPWGAARAWRRGGPLAGLAAVLTAFVVTQVLVFARAANWWGGASFGPRLLSETQPALLLLCLPLIAPLAASPRLVRPAWIALAGWSICLQAIGGLAYTASWNSSPVPVDRAPERNWDWRDNPAARDLRMDNVYRLFLTPAPLQEWRASYRAPAHLAATPGERLEVPIVVRNAGRQRWLAFGDHQGCFGLKLISRLRAHEGTILRAEGVRTYLSGIVPPGGRVTVPLIVEAPSSPGDYWVEATLLQECVDWFDARGSRPARVSLAVR